MVGYENKKKKKLSHRGKQRGVDTRHLFVSTSSVLFCVANVGYGSTGGGDDGGSSVSDGTKPCQALGVHEGDRRCLYLARLTILRSSERIASSPRTAYSAFLI